MTHARTIYLERSDTGTRAALVENDKVLELAVEMESSRSVVGNVYRGKVKRVIAGMQAAFIDIGLAQPGFLHRRDLTASDSKIESLLHEGQSITVAVSKAPRGSASRSKGASLTTDITLVTDTCVYLPLAKPAGVIASKKLLDKTDYSAVLLAAQALVSDLNMDGKVIVRSNAASQPQQLSDDIRFLAQQWQVASNNAERAPQLLIQGPNLAQRMLSDQASTQACCVSLLGSKADLEQLDLSAWSAAGNGSRDVQLISAENALSLKVSAAFEQALARRVRLANGGEIVIDYTEAMTVIDVNTAAAVNSNELYHQTNLLAAQEIAHQLRLRGLAGIIVVDFIDVQAPKQRTELLEVLQQELARDSVQTTFGAHSKLGLVEITRAREQQSLAEQLHTSCASCEGTGLSRRGDFE